LPFAAVPSDADNNMYIARGAVEPVPLACLAALSHHRPPPPHQSVPLSLHDALPICDSSTHESKQARFCCFSTLAPRMAPRVSCANTKAHKHWAGAYQLDSAPGHQEFNAQPDGWAFSFVRLDRSGTALPHCSHPSLQSLSTRNVTRRGRRYGGRQRDHQWVHATAAVARTALMSTTTVKLL